MRYSTRTKDVTVQCKNCKDLFDTTLVDRRGEITVEPSSSYSVQYPLNKNDLTKITHRCGGKIVIIWPRTNGPLFEDWPSFDPLEVAA